MSGLPGTLMRDLRHAARDLLRHRSFTAAALLALALGIGACTATSSVVDRILFRSLPYRQAERLVSAGMFAPILPQADAVRRGASRSRDAGGVDSVAPRGE